MSDSDAHPGWAELHRLWLGIERGDTSAAYTPGRAFEQLVLRAFELEGAEVVRSYGVDEDGHTIEEIDGAVYLDGRDFLVECKDTIRRIGIGPIAKLRNQLLRRPGGVIGLVFSRTGFTEPARTLARFSAPQTIILWEGIEIGYLLDRQKAEPAARVFTRALERKRRYAIEHARPTFNVATEESLE